MKQLTFKRISILSLVLLVASAATAFIAKDKKVFDQPGHLTNDANDTSTAPTCRTPIVGDEEDCNDTQVNGAGSTSAAAPGASAAPGAGGTSSDAGANTTSPD